MRALWNFRPNNQVRKYTILLNIAVKSGIVQLLLEMYRVRCCEYMSGNDSALPSRIGNKQKSKRDQYTLLLIFKANLNTLLHSKTSRTKYFHEIKSHCPE